MATCFFGARGIDIWDGFTWENMNPYNSAFPSVSVYDMLEDTDGNLWFATFSGLVRWSKSDNIMEVYTPENSGIRSPLVYTLYQATDGKIYAGHRWDETYLGEVTIFNMSGTVIGTVTSGEDGMYGSSVEDIVEDQDHNIWIATAADPATGEYGGVNKYNPGSDTVEVFYNKDNSDLPTNEVSSLAVDEAGNLWVGLFTNAGLGHTEGGLVMFDGTNWTYYNKTNGDEIGNSIRGLLVSEDGTLWIAAGDGAYSYDGSTLAKVTGGEDDGLALTNVLGVSELYDGRIAFAKTVTAGQGGGVSFLDPSDDSWEHISTRDGGLASQAIFGAAYDSQGNLWATGFYGLQKFDGDEWTLWTEKDGLTATYGWDLIVDSNDNVWVNGALNGLTRVNADGTIDTITEHGVFVESNWEARNGDMWFGDYNDDYDGTGNFYSNGMLRYDGTNYTVFDSTDGLPAGNMGTVTSISEDADGNILAATWDGLYKLESGTFAKFEFDGYTGGSVEKVHLDSNDRVWVSYQGNIHMFDGTEWQAFYGFGWVEDIEHDISGRVWFAQSNGAVVYDEGEFHKITPKNGFPSMGTSYANANTYDLAPSRTDASKMAFGLYRAGITVLDTDMPVEITSLTDNPDDQGGWLRLKVDGYLLSPQYTGAKADGWRAEVMMDGHWEAASPLSPSRSGSISVQVPVTKETGAVADETNSFDFRVVALDIDGKVVGISAPVNGFAEDNIVPSQVVSLEGVTSETEVSLSWAPVPDNDLKFYAAYESSVTDFAGNEPIAVTTSTQLSFDNDGYGGIVVVAVDDHNNYGPASEQLVVTGVEKQDEGIEKFELTQNYPNPFNPSTQFSYNLPQSAKVNITVFNSLGQAVKVLVNEVQTAGAHQVTFRAGDLPSGMYIYRIQAGSFTQTRKMTLLK